MYWIILQRIRTLPSTRGMGRLGRTSRGVAEENYYESAGS
jgi:hypothetical protein